MTHCKQLWIRGFDSTKRFHPRFGRVLRWYLKIKAIAVGVGGSQFWHPHPPKNRFKILHLKVYQNKVHLDLPTGSWVQLVDVDKNENYTCSWIPLLNGMSFTRTFSSWYLYAGTNFPNNRPRDSLIRVSSPASSWFSLLPFRKLVILLAVRSGGRINHVLPK